MEQLVNRWLTNPVMGRTLGAALALVLVLVIVRLVQRRLTPKIADTDTRYRFRKFVGFLGYSAGALILAVIFSDRLGTLGVTLGVAGAGVAFALQEVIVSVAGWISIMFGGTYKVGDRVLLGGITGDVIDIGVLRTTLMECGAWVAGDLYNGRIVKVGNSFVFKEPVTNYTSDFPFLWDEIQVPVTHDSNRAATRRILQAAADDIVGDYARQALNGWKQIVNRYRIEDASVGPTVTLTANENWMTFTLRYVVNYRQRRSTKDQLWQRVLDDIHDSEGAVAVAYSTLFVHTAPLRIANEAS